MKSPVFKNIVWAVDTMEPGDFHRNADSILKSLTQETPADVVPVHILSYPFASPSSTTDYEQAYLALSEKRLKELVRDSRIPNLRTGRVFINRKGTVRDAVEMLIDFAKLHKADAIAASTHSRGAVARFFMGSFAESLLLQSPIPVITVNPQAKVREKISKVLFPTPFTKNLRPGFEFTVKLCQSLGASLTVLFKEPFIPMLETSYEFVKYLEQDAEERRHDAEEWRKWAEQNHIPIEVHMDTQPGDIADEITTFADKNNYDLVVMVSQASDLGGPFVGSLCRRVVRSVCCPVLTLSGA